MISRIIQIRNEAELSQEKFAKKIGLSRNFINQVESGKKNISDRTISDICREFDINEDWLRYGTEPMKKVSDGDEYTEIAARIDKNDPKARQAIIDYWNLSDRDKELWWNFVDKFFKNDGAE